MIVFYVLKDKQYNSNKFMKIEKATKMNINKCSFFAYFFLFFVFIQLSEPEKIQRKVFKADDSQDLQILHALIKYPFLI